MKYFTLVHTSIITACLLLTTMVGCQAPVAHSENFPAPDPTPEATETTTEGTPKMEIATFGGGCFWCTEAVFQQLKGVKSVKSGYMGGSLENPTYEQVCNKATNSGHVEVIQIEFDPSVIRFEDLLHVHWKTHDPTTMDRQGNDRGPQYRSAVFYHNEVQKEKSASYKKKLNDQKCSAFLS